MWKIKRLNIQTFFATKPKECKPSTNEDWNISLIIQKMNINISNTWIEQFLN